MISVFRIEDLLANDLLGVSDCFYEIGIEFDDFDCVFLHLSQNVVHRQGLSCSWRACNHQYSVFIFVFFIETVLDVRSDAAYLLVAKAEVLGHLIPA